MNRKLILFSAVMIAGIGTVMGLGLAEMRAYIDSDHSSSNGLHRSYAIAGTGVGFLVGAGLEAVRELKKQQDREEALRNYLHTYLSLRDIDNQFDK